MMIKVAILGFGTVGSGVAEVLDKNAAQVTAGAGTEIQVKYIVDVRDFPGSPYAAYMTKDFTAVENDPEVQIVVETIGGAKIAYEFTKRALLAGKCVVTSNKELVATHGSELMEIAQEKGGRYLFEASVGGGIPVIQPIRQCLAANRLDEIYGILNGTTNYILTRMFQNGLPFDAALREAQEKGYAEADPTADVEGIDACRKISILSSLCFGRHVDPAKIPTKGITSVTGADVAIAGQKGYTLKLIGRGLTEDGKVFAYVAPHLVPGDSMIAGVTGVMNGILVKGNAVGSVLFYGAGAGKLPTASAVVSDVIETAKKLGQEAKPAWTESEEDFVGDADTLKSRWYVRVPAGSAVSDELEYVGSAEGSDGYLTPEKCALCVGSLLEGLEVRSLFRVLA